MAPDATSYQLSFHEFQDGKTKEESKIQGYKVCFLMNLKEDRERIVGVSLGSLNRDDRALLRQRDRKEEHKQERDWVHGTIPASRRKDGELAVRVTTVASLAVVHDETGKGFRANGVLQYSMRKPDGPFRLLTNAPLKAGKPAQGLSFVQHYQKRFGGAENQGVRELNQKWQLKTPVGRKRNALYARIAMAVMQFNNLKVLASVKRKEFADLEETRKKRGRRSLLAGYGVVVYVGQSYGVFSGEEFGELMQRRENQRVRQQLLAACHDRGLDPALTKELLASVALPT